MVLGILNLEGCQNWKIGSKVSKILPFFSKKNQNFKCGHVGCLSRGNRLDYCAAHSDFTLRDSIWSKIPKNHFQGLKTYKDGPISESVLWDPTSDMLAQIEIWVCSSILQSIASFEPFMLFRCPSRIRIHKTI